MGRDRREDDGDVSTETAGARPVWVSIGMRRSRRIQLAPLPRPATPPSALTRAALHTAPADASGADQRTPVPQAAGDHPGSPGEVEPAPQIHLTLRRREERLAESEGHRTAHDGQGQVEQVDHRGHGPTDQGPGALHDIRRGDDRPDDR